MPIRTETRYVVSALLGVAVLVALVLVGLSHSGAGSTVSTSAGAPAAASTPSSPPTSTPTSTPASTAQVTMPTVTTPTVTTPSVTTPAAPAASKTDAATDGKPTITGFDPNHGPPGTQVTVTGSGFMSSDGQITAYFGSQSASTSCPEPNTCTVVVPDPPPGAGPVQVTIVTASGRSNAVVFTYG